MIGFFDSAFIVRGFPIKLDGFFTGDIAGVLDFDVNGDDLLLASENGILGWVKVNDLLAEFGVD